jgi:hypothetical protein
MSGHLMHLYIGSNGFVISDQLFFVSGSILDSCTGNHGIESWSSQLFYSFMDLPCGFLLHKE